MHSSLIIPCYNEAQNLTIFFESAVKSFKRHGKSCEFVFVNDGSADETVEVLVRLISCGDKNVDPTVSFVILELSRNFGKEAAMFAGLEHCTGDYIGFIDADMQQDPELACSMLSYLEDNQDYDCVAAVQKTRKESFLIKTAKKAFYWLFNHMGDTQLLPHSSDFRFFTRRVADAILQMPEQYRFSKGLFSWIGFKTHVIDYEPAARAVGKSRWSFRKLFSYGWNGVLAFSTWPLRLVMYCGLITALISLMLLAYDLFEKLAFGFDIPAFQLVLYATLILGGIQMFVLGIFGEYMARTYVEAKRRPVYLVRREYSTEDFRDKDGMA